MIILIIKNDYLRRSLVNHENICHMQIKIWRANDIF